MKKNFLLFILLPFFFIKISQAQTIPNSDLETWINHGFYDDPQYWDTPNQEVCTVITGFTKVVTKSTDHQSGSFSAKLETKTIPVFGVVVPGVITLGKISIDIQNQTYSITGGVPISEPVTHLKGFYKFIPKGGDSCVIGIELTKWNNGIRDTIGAGYFSTHDTITAWTPFSAWINMDSVETADTMNILAISSATYDPTPGTVLFVDGLYLDYTVGVNDDSPSAGIDLFQDRELQELEVFLNFSSEEQTCLKLYNIMGQVVKEFSPEMRKKEKFSFGYSNLADGIYVLEIIHNNKKFTRKFMFHS